MSKFKLYKITQTSTGAVYYGIVLKSNKTIHERFKEHLDGLGSTAIADMILSGCSRNDFTIDLIEEFDKIDHVSMAEVSAIRNCKENKIPCLNRNCGGGFIGKKFFFDSSLHERGWDVNLIGNKTKTDIQLLIERNCSNSHLYKKLILRRNKSTKISLYLKFLFDFTNEIFNILCKYKLLKIYRILRKYHPIYIKRCFEAYNDDLRLFEYLLTIDTKEEIDKFRYACRQYFVSKRHPILINIHEECDEFFEYFFLSKHANILPQFKERYGRKINSPAETLGWKIGRENFKQRTSNGIKTQLEIDSNENRSISIKKDWESRTEEYIIEKTGAGLSCMNDIKYTCNICNKPNLTIGNLNRWHNTRCKFNEN